ncbi:hypothetical protein [Streptomyces sp. NPDC058108]|uniref:hypothetical protein n=1 Tax=Streptomyces sp. NPDC058108 TaxID=3346344 RepID=UPI0036E47E08
MLLRPRPGMMHRARGQLLSGRLNDVARVPHRGLHPHLLFEPVPARVPQCGMESSGCLSPGLPQLPVFGVLLLGPAVACGRSAEAGLQVEDPRCMSCGQLYRR